MGRQIIKVSRELDQYVVWSSIVESWVYIGTRDEMLLDYPRTVGRGSPRVEIVKAMARADEFGSSAYEPFTWRFDAKDDRQQLWHSQGEDMGAPLGAYHIKRSDFPEIVRRWIAQEPIAELADRETWGEVREREPARLVSDPHLYGR